MSNEEMKKEGFNASSAEHEEGQLTLNLDELAYGPPGVRGVFASSYVAMCAAFATIGGLLFGYDQGVISVTLVMDHFLERFPEVSDTAAGSGFYKGLMTAMITLGAFLGAINQCWAADAFSRKYCIMIAVVIFLVGSALQVGAVSYTMLVIARLIGGIGIGMLSGVVPLYIGEIAAPEIRGTLLVFEQISIVTGVVVAFWITYGTKEIEGNWSWQLPFLLQIVPAIFLGLGATLLPFSPRWLATKGREEEALINLAKLRQLPTTDNRVRQEWMEVIAESKFQQKVLEERHPKLVASTTMGDKLRLEIVTWTDCFKAGCWKRTQVGAGLMFFQQFVGINALIYYSPTLFKTMGLDYNMQLIMSGVLNMVQLVGCISSLWTLDTYGRRKLLFVGSIGMTLSHTIIAILVGKFSYDWPGHSAEGWTSVAFLMIFMLAYGCTWGPVPWAMPAEIFPSSLRAKGVSISSGSNWLNNFIIGLITPPLVQNTGFGAYAFFAVFSMLSFVWAFFTVPETAHKTLEQMDEVFNDRGGAADVEKKNQILSDVIREKSNTVQSA
ncbi:putative MFS monosaccharide transporter [Pestalotiopsis sp. NC0098]|nr:putative MFS monosaccharide transporter [Pestalotiopsis sp. NC0098]